MPFKPFNYAQAVGAGTQNALGQAQFMGAAKDFKRQNALEGAFKQASETKEDPAALLEAQGYGMEANALREQGLQRAASGLDWLAKAAPRVGPQTYGKFKQQAEQFGIADPGELPDQFDPELMKTLAGNAQQQWETLMGPRGTLLQRNAGTGELKQIVGQESKGPTVNVNTGDTTNAYDKKFSESLAGQDAKRADEIFTAADQAEAMAGNLTHIEGMLNDGLQTGQLEPMKLTLGRTMQAFGIDPTEAGLSDVSTAEEFNRVATQLSLDALQQFKGATSEKELDVARNTMAGLGTSVEGNRRFIDTMRQLQQRAAMRAQMLDQHLSDEGTYRGFNKKWSDHIKANPLFQNPGQPAGQRGGSAPAQGGAASPVSQSDYDALPSGALFIDPDDGKTYRKP